MKAAHASVLVACAFLVSCALGGGAKAPPLQTGREFLLPQQPETTGYGLYSYLLFGSPPTDSNRDRCLAAAAAYIETLPRITDMLAYAPPSHLNITYLPVTDLPPPEVLGLRAGATGPPLAKGAQWVLEHFDYARASVVLAAVPGRHLNGPYLVSARRPLTGSERLTGEYGVQDLSAAPPELITAWVTEFIDRSQQDNPFGKGNARELVLTMRGVVREAARQWPQVVASVDTWITWTR
jgi:hypothetical protein